MIKHVYLFKLRDRASAPEVLRKLETLRDRVPSIHRLELGIDFRGAGNSCDLIEVCEFLTREDFERFGGDAYHEQIRRYLATVVESSCKIDYEL